MCEERWTEEEEKGRKILGEEHIGRGEHIGTEGEREEMVRKIGGEEHIGRGERRGSKGVKKGEEETRIIFTCPFLSMNSFPFRLFP